MDSIVQCIGLMSGTSLDGLDVCSASFKELPDGNFGYEINAAETIHYPADIGALLATAHTLNALDFVLFHNKYGKFTGERVAEFIKKHGCKPTFIASHGHTVFHRPERGLTFQIGSGAEIAAAAGVSVVCDFRSLDVALGGQGAPLVPAGDKLLFSDYDYCLNIGGFANISFEQNDLRTAYDVCPANIVLNMYAERCGKAYDASGKLAASGRVCEPLLDTLNGLEFYSRRGPKSLGREWVERCFVPAVERCDISTEDKLRTVCEHIAIQTAACTGRGRMLVTGGGAFNTFLMQRISELCACDVCVPDELTVNFKEALIFAFLGLLYVRSRVGCLASVTGAHTNNIGGAMYKVY